MTGKYDDIIHLPHHVSATRPRMPMLDRAAQFSPFAALTGYEAAMRETARLTDQRVELDESAKVELDRKLRLLLSLPGQPEVSITYFRPDERKEGGAYETATGRIKKYDESSHTIVLADRTRICIEDVFDLESDALPALPEATAF
ncbi:hypothetical protein [Pseudoflavonifractor phocaeensis]|uniref:hypothetical protein n=1 Tax=Pseudoflavonifractor phocaeensis TaxID=1870988 RepID=UPI00210989E8|nr:hypothetical protein [Pseudoflavonifractor phocaeensis]MCQ4862743.1 hypothetical protein [Pseudoflavonifractor phocaeensis]